MNIFICIKQVPKTENIKLKAGEPFRDKGLERHINTFDTFALEEAARTKDQYGDTRIILISMGPESTERCLIEGLSLGADKAYHLKDDLFLKNDSLTTARLLAQAIRSVEKIEGPADVILTGRQSTDSGLGLIPIMLSEILSVKLVPSVTEFYYEPAGHRVLMMTRGANDFSSVSSELPVIISMTKGSHEVRFPTFKRIREANRAEIGRLSSKEVEYDPPRTEVLSVIKPGRNSKNAVVNTGDDEESTMELLEMLKEDNIFAR